MRFAFVYDEAEDTHPAEGSSPSLDPQEQHAQGRPPSEVRIALAARRAHTRGLFDFDRAHASLNRLLYTVSTLQAPSTTPLEPEADEFGQGEMFCPQAFRAPDQGALS